jgi:TRAP-type C4-dicarboxylate transport system permease large subunit
MFNCLVTIAFTFGMVCVVRLGGGRRVRRCSISSRASRWSGLAQNMIDQLNSTTLMSLSLFVMAAAFMRRGGVARALVDLASAWLGGAKGSLGLVAIVSCTLFAAISGSSVATALATGTILLPAGELVQFAAEHGFSTWEFLLTVNLLLLVIGGFLEVVSTLLLVMPILAPVLLPLGVDPLHFGIIFTHNMEVGLVHPPVGLNLYVLSTISDAPVGEVVRGILPFLVILLAVLAVITYVPWLTMWLPEAIYGR